jgi:hypothetical protein
MESEIAKAYFAREKVRRSGGAFGRGLYGGKTVLLGSGVTQRGLG